jgi:uncharacterized protein (TIGR00251 family)
VEGPTKLTLRVSPGATRNGVVGRHGTAWKVRVAAPPQGGKANDALLRLLAETLQVPRRDVEIVSGHGAREKIVALAGIGRAEVDRRLATATRRTGKERE